MTAARAIPARIEDWQSLPAAATQPWLGGARPAVVTRDALGREWTDEDIRRYWRRAARMRMRAAFAEHGYSDCVADVVALEMQRALSGYHGPDEHATPVPFYNYAYDGCEEGFMQAWNCPQDPRDPAEDEMPTWASQHAEYERTGRAQALALFTASLNHAGGVG